MKIINILFLLTILACGNLFANVASITAIKGDAIIKRATQILKARLGASLKTKDTILTKNAKMQIIFNDDTIISVGKNSKFIIEDYLFGSNKEPVARFSILKGAMRTITGKIAKIAPSKFKVRTRTATIGVRGTNFSVFVEKDGSFKTFCTFGEISVKINNQEHAVPQNFSLALSSTGVIRIKEFSIKDLQIIKQRNFTIPSNKKSKRRTSSKSKDKKSKNKINTMSTTENNEQIDTTNSQNDMLAVADIENSSYDSVQSETITQLTELADKIKKEDALAAEALAAAEAAAAEAAAAELLTNNNEPTEPITPVTDPNTIETVNGVISAYIMPNASYAGSYTTTNNNNANFAASGDSQLDIDFNADSATLTLGAPTLELIHKSTDVKTNFSFQHYGNINDTSASGNGTADGKFYGTTGNIVKGDFNYDDGTYQSVGTYDATSSQTLN